MTIHDTFAEREDRPRAFKVIPRRRWTLVAEYLGGYINETNLSACWMKDNESGDWYVAESWKRPNLRYRLNAEQVAFVESQIQRLAAQSDARGERDGY